VAQKIVINAMLSVPRVDTGMPYRTELITGVSSGIRLDAARYAMARGARVFGSVRSQASGEQTRRALDQALRPDSAEASGVLHLVLRHPVSSRPW
jgi:NAD(P)-dependent dehydrogenase (short-subunit alcohol dehydrogenase family)